jgi:NAD(P)-dependent dehydrogenase (short-subunit alcohol dehydrogenase family)
MDRITTGFDIYSTAAEIVAGVDLSGRRMVVTGGASGIGVETTRALAGAGADVTVAVRDVVKGEQVAAQVRSTIDRGSVTVAPLDLTDRGSIDAFVGAWDGPLDVLVNNAGIMATPETYTPEGWELQLATNHLGHFALAHGLHPALAAAGGARIVSVSSTALYGSPVVLDDLFFRHRPYDPDLAYAQSKTANVLFAVEADRRWRPDGIRANALMPGAIATNLQRHSGGIQTPPELQKTTEQGASTSVLLAASPVLQGVGGRYFVNNEEAEVLDEPTEVMGGVAPYALDPETARRLWDVSLELLGLTDR